jgi:hypothetical protein
MLEWEMIDQQGWEVVHGKVLLVLPEVDDDLMLTCAHALK